MRDKLRNLFIVVIPFLSLSAAGQFSQIHIGNDPNLRKAKDHFLSGHYRQTKEDVRTFQKNSLEGMTSINYQTAFFLDVLSSLEMKEPGSEAIVSGFIDQCLYDAMKQYASMAMARYYFKNHDYARAIPYYEKASITYLTNQEIAERNFELAYCYLINKQIEKVEPLFATIKNVRGPYYVPGNYYSGLMAYYKGHYEEALKSFEAIRGQDAYKDIVPFYIAELNYFKGNKDRALELAEDYLSKGDRMPYYGEMSQLAGYIYYEKEDAEKASKYLTGFIEKKETVAASDLYMLGDIFYRMGENEKAIETFRRISTSDQKMVKQSLYALGLAYLKNGEKENAYSAFEKALEISEPLEVDEELGFNTAKLAYDLDKSNVAYTYLNQFSRSYPGSDHIQNTLEMLCLLDIKNKNFDEAIKNINRMEEISPGFQAVYQKMNYARGVQMLIDNHSDRAIPYFNESKKYSVDEDIEGLSEFWKAECFYRLGNYLNAIAASNTFIQYPGRGNSSALIRNAYLLNAYSYYHLNDKEQVKEAFIKSTGTTDNLTATQVLEQMDSLKPNFVPSHVPYVEADPYILIYRMPEEQIKFDYKPQPLKPKSLEHPNEDFLYTDFLKLGYGNLKTPLFQLGWNMVNTTGSNLYIQFLHRSSRGSDFKYQDRSRNKFSATYRKKILGHDIRSDFAMERNVFHYYPVGSSTLSRDDIKQRNLNTTFDFDVYSLERKLSGLYAGFQTGIGFYNSSHINALETRFHFSLPLSRIVSTGLSYGLGLKTDVNHYDNGLQKQNSSYFSLQPYLSYTSSAYSVYAGVYPTASISGWQLLPNIYLSTNLGALNGKASIGIESELQTNTYREQSTANPYLSSFITLVQGKRALGYVGLAGNTSMNVSYRFKGGFGRIKNLPLYLNDTMSSGLPQFGVVYEPQANIFYLDAAAEYNLSKNASAGAQFIYQPIIKMQTYPEAYHYVSTQMRIYADYQLFHNLFLHGELLTRSAVKALGDINHPGPNGNNAFDLNFHARYRWNRKWNFYFELNNLMNNKYQRWYGYPSYGLNVNGGIIYSFNKSFNEKNLKIFQ